MNEKRINDGSGFKIVMKTKIIAIISAVAMFFAVSFCPFVTVPVYAAAGIATVAKATGDVLWKQFLKDVLYQVGVDVAVGGVETLLNEIYNALSGNLLNDLGEEVAPEGDMAELFEYYSSEAYWYDDDTGTYYFFDPDESADLLSDYISAVHSGTSDEIDINDYDYTVKLVKDGNVSTVETVEDIPISGQTFADIVERLNQQYAPAADTERVSFQNTYFANADYCEGNNFNSFSNPFICDGELAGYNLSKAVYVVLYVVDSEGQLYVSPIHYTFNAVVENDDVNLYATAENVYEKNLIWENNKICSLTATPYLAMIPAYSPASSGYTSLSVLKPFSSYTDYLQLTQSHYINSFHLLDYDYFSAANGIQQVVTAAILSPCFYGLHSCEGTSGDKYDLRSEYAPTDFGYFVSDEPIDCDGYFPDIDPSKIDPNATVTMTGGDVYEYTITSPSGDTSTVNEYITNNYTYITNNYGNGSGGSGTTGGAYDYENPNVAEALEQIPELSDSYVNYLERFFSWLPPEILGLLIGGIGIAIVCRLAGR